MEYFISAVCLAAFAYFIYTRVQKSRDRKAGPYSPAPTPKEPRDFDRYEDRHK